MIPGRFTTAQTSWIAPASPRPAKRLEIPNAKQNTNETTLNIHLFIYLLRRPVVGRFDLLDGRIVLTAVGNPLCWCPSSCRSAFRTKSGTCQNRSLDFKTNRIRLEHQHKGLLLRVTRKPPHLGDELANPSTRGFSATSPSKLVVWGENRTPNPCTLRPALP